MKIYRKGALLKISHLMQVLISRTIRIWKRSTLPWESPWAHCSRAASVHLCSACVCPRHFQSSCRKLLSVHPWHPRVGSASWWKDRNNHRFLKQKENKNYISTSSALNYTDKRNKWLVANWCSNLRIMHRCCSAAGLLGNGERQSRPSPIPVKIINSTGEEPLVTVFLSGF